MNRLQRIGTLPVVWIPPGEIRDKRELFRARMLLSRQRVRIKNRILSTLAKYGLRIEDTSDAFNKKGTTAVVNAIEELPAETKFAACQLMDELELIDEKIRAFEQRMAEVFGESNEIQLLKSIPGIGSILSVVIASEIGDIGRFPTASHFASYGRYDASSACFRWKVSIRGNAIRPQPIPEMGFR